MILLNPKPTWNTVDSTKLATYQQCPRRYFYNYVLGWVPDSERNDKWFGSSWHIAMEHIILNKYSPVSIIEAYRLFEQNYREKFPEHTDELYFPKVPGIVMLALSAYAGQYIHDPDEYDVLYTEIAGTVPIGEHRRMTFKMDTILRNVKTGMVRSREHKTANKKGGNDKFKMSVQIGTYDHVLKCLFHPDVVECIEINKAIFTKGDSRKGEHGKYEFERIEIQKYPQMSNVWLWNTNQWYDELERDMETLLGLSDAAVEDPYMPCFKQNTESCMDFWGCPYLPFCLVWHNPLQHLDQVPIGYVEEHWDPMAEQSIKTRVEL